MNLTNITIPIDLNNTYVCDRVYDILYVKAPALVNGDIIYVDYAILFCFVFFALGIIVGYYLMGGHNKKV